jgi:antitoxin component YwqK of YwqJK toxin-antitoxin module
MDSEPIDADELEDLGDYRVAVHGVPVTGRVAVRDAEGRTVAIMTYDGGIQAGLTRTFYPDGQVKSERWYEGGVPKGVGRDWYGNGQLRSKAYYDLGQVLDERTWAEDGTRLSGPDEPDQG